jgi:hypothetical protein
VQIPQVHRRQPGEAQHGLSVTAHGQLGRLTLLVAREPLLPSSDGNAGRQALHVPLPWPRQCLVEIVHIEDEIPLRRREQSEVDQVRITARLDRDAGRRAPGEIIRHDRGTSAIEGERRGQHPAVTNRDQVLLPGPGLYLEDVDGIRPIGRRFPLRMSSPWLPLPSSLSGRPPRLRTQVLRTPPTLVHDHTIAGPVA